MMEFLRVIDKNPLGMWSLEKASQKKYIDSSGKYKHVS